ncbi:hypothetical protein C6P45_001512 [Maudiozyma exigua]|uniref:Uncharacterized protein n=1 Tax=Maudiozyma exigua TaxID=34358 RepID=A0A9P6WD87_MAUEX|nr:hypothetical protein C6P45_001512 [Kazachstania exigua]
MSSNNLTTNLDTIKELYKKTEKLNEEIKNVIKDIKPMEFESYADYFLIHTFKRGISESGRVNLDGLRRKEKSIYYKRIRRSNDPPIDENISLPPKRSSSGDSSTSITPLQTLPSSDKENEYVESTSHSLEKKPVNNVSAEISLNSIISKDGQADNENHNIRRSSRISQKDREDKLKRDREELEAVAAEEENANRSHLNKKQKGRGRPSKSKYTESSSGCDINGDNNISSEEDEIDASKSDKVVITDLYENLVEKIKDPQRRSDWLLPPKMKFSQEKQLHTRPEYKTVKIHELVNTNRISAILSRFEGGLAGVRSKDVK